MDNNDYYIIIIIFFLLLIFIIFKINSYMLDLSVLYYFCIILSILKIFDRTFQFEH